MNSGLLAEFSFGLEPVFGIVPILTTMLAVNVVRASGDVVGGWHVAAAAFLPVAHRHLIALLSLISYPSVPYRVVLSRRGRLKL